MSVRQHLDTDYLFLAGRRLFLVLIFMSFGLLYEEILKGEKKEKKKTTLNFYKFSVKSFILIAFLKVIMLWILL